VTAQAVRDQAVLLEHGLISRVGPRDELLASAPSAEIVDASGGFVLPGMVNAHAHLTFMYFVGPTSIQRAGRSPADCTAHAVRVAAVLLARGITTIRDMGGVHRIPLEMRRLIASGLLPGPRVIAVNQPIAATGGHAGYLAEKADGADGFRHAARHQLELGADFIKVMASHDPWEMPGPEKTRPEVTADEIAAAVDAAHAWGKKAGCHVMGSTAIARALDAGVDIIEHGHYLTPELADRMAAQGVSYTPTLSSYDVQTMHPRFRRGQSWAEEHARLRPAHSDAIANAIHAGVRILNGTDSVGCYAEEVALLRTAGMSAADSLLACTRWPAEALGIDDRLGTVQPGKAADLVLLDGDPLVDPYALEKVSTVIKDGIRYDPQHLTYGESFVPADQDLRALARHWVG